MADKADGSVVLAQLQVAFLGGEAPYKGLKGKASIPTDDPIPLVGWAPPWLGAEIIIILWHIRSPLLILIFISVAFSPHTIRDWNALPDFLISSAEGVEDGVAKFTSLVRAND